MTSWPLTPTGEILVDGAWQSVSMRADSPVTVTRGMNSEGSIAQPGKANVAIDNRDGEYSPRNPNSSLFGKIGRNTQFRLRVDDVPADPAPGIIDTFARTETNGWGDADSGETWTIYDPFGISPSSSDFAVSGGTGQLTLSAANSSRFIRLDAVDESDFEATFTVATDTAAVSNSGGTSVSMSFMGRLDSTNHNWYEFQTKFLTGTGLAAGEGLHVDTNIIRVDDGSSTTLSTAQAVAGLTYQAGVALRVRVQCIGAELRLRVWTDGTTEPKAWHSQAYDETYTSGEIGYRGVTNATLTTFPFEVHAGDLEVRDPTEDTGVVRISAEIPAWPPRRTDESGNDVTTPTAPAGLLRRMGQGTKPLKSTMRRHIPQLFPMVYWPLEEGAQGDTQAADATLTGTGGPLTVFGMEFAKDSDLVGSDPLPKITDSAGMSSAAVPGTETGFWSVNMLFRINDNDYPDDANEHTILEFVTSGSAAERWVISLQLDAGVHRMRARIFDESNTELTTFTANHEAAIGGGGPSLLNAWRLLRVRAQEDGADLDVFFDWQDPDGGASWGNSGTIVSTSAGRFSRIDTTFGDGVAGMFLGHITAWGVLDHSAYTGSGDATTGAQSSTTGLRGQTTRNFLNRLVGQEDIPLEITGPAEERLGPYPTGTALELIRQAAATEMGLLTEQRAVLGLKHQARETLYNQTVALTLNWANGEVFAPFDPTDDDKGVKNEMTAKRREGSEATSTLSTGRLSVQDPPDGIGKYDVSVDTIVDSDDQLPDQAGWRLHVATVDEMRVPQLTLKMGNPRLQGLIDTVLLIDIGSRIRIINTPDYYGPDGFDLLVLGYKETFGVGRWDITFTCSPAGPWNVFVLGDRILGRADTSGSELASLVTASGTSLVVATDSGYRTWITTATHPTEFPFNVQLGGEVVRVTAITGSASPQTFTVVRGVNGVSRSWPAGTRIRLSRSAVGL